uniref:Putative ovule protein n=1 Tax=Solanum chacoense TaxID=4108 RepID=A0A0V0IB46_SOLCH
MKTNKKVTQFRRRGREHKIKSTLIQSITIVSQSSDCNRQLVPQAISLSLSREEDIPKLVLGCIY